MGPSCQIRLASASPAAPNSAIDASTPANSAKVQTHSAKTGHFQRFSPNRSALWRPHPLRLASAPPPVGGNCTTRGSVITHREGSHGRQTGELHYTSFCRRQCSQRMSRQTGGIALHGGPTRRRHAARGLRVVQNPHRHQPEVRRVASKTGAGPLGAKKLAQNRPSRGSSTKNFARHGPSGGSSATKLAQHA